MTVPHLSAAVQALYPFAPQDFAALSGRMSYVDHGPRDGRPVLLLHGNPSWSFLWRDLILKLAAQGRRVIAPDHVGMGLSARPDRFLRLADRIADVEALIAHLGLKEFDLGVHDWGGAIGFGGWGGFLSQTPGLSCRPAFRPASRFAALRWSGASLSKV